MLKKTVIGAALAASVISIAAVLLSDPSGDPQDNPAPDVAADIIMPTKVSRPGCEEDDACYVPSNLTVRRGQVVTWLNEDSAFHSVTSGLYDSPTGLFDSGHLDPYESFSYAFEEAGTYDYYCTLHPWMEARITVE